MADSGEATGEVARDDARASDDDRGRASTTLARPASGRETEESLSRSNPSQQGERTCPHLSRRNT